MSKLEGKRIAIVADWLTNQGGAEQVVSALAATFPEAPIYTSVYTSGSVPALEGCDIRGSWLQALPAKLRRKHQFLLPLLPGAFARLDLREFDIIISSSSAFAKCVKKTRPDQLHFCYCHTPTRYLYHARDEYLTQYPLPKWLRPLKFLLPRMLDRITAQDLAAAKHVDYFMSNSHFVADRIEKFYGRKATTIYPCTDVEQFAPANEKPANSYFLALGRFIPYKRFDLLVKTFAQNGLPLKLGGVGPELERCQALAKELQANNIEFVGFVPYQDLPQLYAGARAFLFPAEEDFGLTPVEAMASGVPVIAYGKGGALESVNKQTGVFFDEPNPRSLQQAIDYFISTEQNFRSEEIVHHAHQFSVSAFQQQVKAFIESKINKLGVYPEDVKI